MNTATPLVIINGITNNFPETLYGLQLGNGIFDPTGVTSTQTIALPNMSGTIALTSQLTGQIDGGAADSVYTTPQIIDGGNA